MSLEGRNMLGLPIEEITTDVLVIGAGGAGIIAALTCAESGLNVLLASKSAVGSGSTSMARGGYAAATGYPNEKDSPDVYFEDVMKAGYGLNDPELVRVMVHDINEITEKLDNWGMEAVRDSYGKFSPKLRPGHSFPRTIHNYDATGRVVIKCLRQRLSMESNITVFPHVMISDLVIENNEACGAWGIDLINNRVMSIKSAIIILATGGGGQFYAYTDNSKDSVGDGYGLAFNAGCQFIDMEMVEFQLMCCYPERLMGYAPNSSSFLMAGGRLYNGIGERFMTKYGTDERNPDRSSRMVAVGRELFSGNGTVHGGVYLDLSTVYNEVEKTNPTVTKVFRNAGLNIAYQPVELTLGAHTFLGGIRINKHSETNVSRLLGAGEVAGGIHGANRLPNGALADALAFGLRSGLTAVERIQSEGKTISAKDALPFIQDRIRFYSKDLLATEQLQASIRELSNKYLSVVRTEESLNRALNELAELKDRYQNLANANTLSGKVMRTSVEVHNMLILAELVAKSALCRKESRGCHFRLDYPSEDKEWQKNVVLIYGNKGVSVETVGRGGILKIDR